MLKLSHHIIFNIIWTSTKTIIYKTDRKSKFNTVHSGFKQEKVEFSRPKIWFSRISLPVQVA